MPRTEARPRGGSDGRDGRADDGALVGRLLDGRYRIGRRIARGGMASVHEATDTRLDRTVAIKVMHPGLADDGDFTARFAREARAAARLSHPNVVAVYDQGEDDGSVYLAMEYVPGRTLRDVVREEAPLSPARALALVDPVLSALGAAHRAGLVHRDVKPENVLIADDGRIKVADFGLAKAVSTDTHHTATTGILLGTVSYLAPELLVDGRADARADVYAVGVILHELLTGRKPHEGESPIQVAYRHVHEDVPPPSALVDGLPAYVDALVARATARERDLRPADAVVLQHQLHRVAHALAHGVDEDEELTEDLLPPRVSDDTVGLHDPDPTRMAALARADEDREEAAPSEEHEPTTAWQEPPPTAPVARRRSRRGPALVLVAVLLVLAAGAGTWWFTVGRYTPSPAVLGLTEAEAVDRLQKAGLEAEIGQPAYSENVPADQVLASSPEPGEKVLDGGTVTLTLSLGPERYDVPRLRGRPLERAETMLSNRNLAVGSTTERFHDELPTGSVLRSDPEPGTSLRPDTPVDLVVSKGPKPITVRDFTGEPAARATAHFEDQGLEVTAREEFHDEVAEGRVVSQSPSSGTLVRGESVELVVSRGPELVTIPDGLVRSGVEAARKELEDLGFEVRTEQHRLHLGLGYVASVSPGEGQEAPRGSTVTLTLV